MREQPFFVVLLVAGCVGQPTDNGAVDGGTDGGVEPPTCPVTRSYDGFGGRKLEASREAIEAGSDRLRMKPFVALASEYARALSLASFDTAAYAATFGRPPARWFNEPLASANTLYAAFALAYDACTRHTATDAAFAAAPSTTTATLACHTFAMRAWSRDATDEETAACVSYAVDKTASITDPRARWAYTCASVLTASGFLTY
ncbi:MAG: hypothetical protein AB7T06_10280 [Kofleriaceae bacterium]